MCDYSLESVKSRAAEVGDKLVTHLFTTWANTSSGTRGFAAVGDPDTAVCLLPGTEIAFDAPIEQNAFTPYGTKHRRYSASVGRFIQLETDIRHTHHDALELPDGTRVKLNELIVGQTATVLQLPAQPLVSHMDLPADSDPQPVAQTPYYKEAV